MARKKQTSRVKRMNQNIKKMWLKGLKQYEQASSTLKTVTTEKYCCLGVLCEVIRKSKYNDKIKGRWENDRFVCSNSENSSFLPEQVVELAGLESNDPIIAPRARSKERQTASGRNDLAHDSFKKIGRLIEKNL